MQDAINRRYMIIRIDEHGTKYLVTTVLSELEASHAVGSMVKKQLKPHHQTYDVQAYLLGTLAETCEKEGIIR